MSKSEIGIKLTLTGQQQVQQGLGQVASKASQLGDEFDDLRGRVGVAVGAMGVAIGALVVKVSDAASQIERFAQLAAATPAEFQRFAAGAKSAGMDMEKFASVTKDTQDKIGDFLQTGGGELKDFFEKIAPKIGVTANQFRDLSGPQSLQLFYNSLQKANLSQKETVFWMESIADDATALVPLLANNGAEFDRLADRADKYGAILSDSVLSASKEFKAQTDELSLSMDGAQNIIASAVMPVLSELVRGMLETGNSTDVADAAAAAIRTTLEALIVVGSDVAFTFTTIGRDIGGMAAQAAAFLSLDFARAGQIRAMMKEDAAAARAELDAFQQRVLNAGKNQQQASGLEQVLKDNKQGTAEYKAALQALIQMKDAGTVSTQQYVRILQGVAPAATRASASLSGMALGPTRPRKRPKNQPMPQRPPQKRLPTHGATVPRCCAA